MAVVIEQRQPVRVDDWEASGLPEKGAEVIEGELVTMTPAGKYPNRVALNLIFVFRQFSETRPDLDYGGDNVGFLLRRNPDTLLSPGACLFRPRPAPDAKWLEFAPEIVAEVLSPSNNAAEMVYKRHPYLAAGTEQFWLIDPENRTLAISFRDGRILHAEGRIAVDCEGIAAGLRIELDELFRDR